MTIVKAVLAFIMMKQKILYSVLAAPDSIKCSSIHSKGRLFTALWYVYPVIHRLTLKYSVFGFSHFILFSISVWRHPIFVQSLDNFFNFLSRGKLHCDLRLRLGILNSSRASIMLDVSTSTHLSQVNELIRWILENLTADDLTI